MPTDTSDLREPEKVRACQEKALQALQSYTLHQYPDAPSKFGELLLRIPELQRTCQVRVVFTAWAQTENQTNFYFNTLESQVGKEMLTIKSKDGAEFNLLMELLRGEHWPSPLISFFAPHSKCNIIYGTFLFFSFVRK